MLRREPPLESVWDTSWVHISMVSRALCHFQGLYATFKGFNANKLQGPCATRFKGLSAICYKGFVPPCLRALCHYVQGHYATMFKGFKPLWIKNVIYQAFMFKIGPKAVIRWIQNQANIVTFAFTHILIYVMFQVEHCFIMYYYSLSPAHSLLCLFL